jgi:hypothetical protein
MKKKTYIIFSFVLLILMYGCAGYKPIFNSTDLNFKIISHSIEGNKILGKNIYSKLFNSARASKNKKSLKTVVIKINVLKNKKVSVKDSAGKILEYKITLNAEVEVKDFVTNDIIINQTFTNSQNYGVQSQHSETIKLENKSIESIINKIYQELLIKLSQSILT